MVQSKLLWFLFFCCATVSKATKPKLQLKFPDDFEFGTATSSYQVEGAWNNDGKGMSIWDHLVHTSPEYIYDKSTGDIAANSYHLYKRDVEMIKQLGVNNYRFSISWPRILPNGRPDYINPLGIDYYNTLIDELLANGIQPFVTMYHWDLPQNLQEQGGWLSDDMADWFGDYARVLYQHFGDRVKYWMTINEPYVHCLNGYDSAKHAPKISLPGIGYYECGRNILLANAKAYHIYDNEFRATQDGQVGFVVSMEWPIPASDSLEDAQAVEDFIAFHIEHFAHPIWSQHGNYPQILIDRVDAASAIQGLAASRLRPFTNFEVEFLKETADFLGLNHYSTRMVYRNESLTGRFKVPSIDDDLNVGTYPNASWPPLGFHNEYAPGLYHLLKYLKKQYPDTTIYITENGCATNFSLNDVDRVRYLRNYLHAVLQALYEGVKIRGYFAWSLMDNFEWTFGYRYWPYWGLNSESPDCVKPLSMRFGLYYMDDSHPNRTRTARKSALVFKEIIRSRTINESYDPNPCVDTVEITKPEPDAATLHKIKIFALVLVVALPIVLI